MVDKTIKLEPGEEAAAKQDLLTNRSKNHMAFKFCLQNKASKEDQAMWAGDGMNKIQKQQLLIQWVVHRSRNYQISTQVETAIGLTSVQEKDILYEWMSAGATESPPAAHQQKKHKKKAKQQQSSSSSSSSSSVDRAAKRKDGKGAKGATPAKGGAPAPKLATPPPTPVTAEPVEAPSCAGQGPLGPQFAIWSI